MRTLAALLPVLFATGCTTMADRLHGSLTPPPGEGYAIFSLTGRTQDASRSSASVEWRGLTNTLSGNVYASMGTNTVFGPNGDMAEGKLELLTLPAGRYELTRAYGYWPTDTGPFGNAFTQIRSFSLNTPFTVEAGKAVYLGQVQVQMDFRPTVELGDAQVRDFAHMKNVWKIDNLSQVVVAPFAPRTIPAN